MDIRKVVKAGIAALGLVVSSALPAMAQGGSGNIRGIVRDGTGGVLPGATIVLRAEQGGLGGNQEVVADGQGAYEFGQLPPGTYGVRASLSGFRTVVQQGIRVTANATARADLQLQVGAIEEAIVVSGRAPLLDTTNALRQTSLSAEEQAQLPNRTDVWAMARVIPGVVMSTIDVGGLETFAQTALSVRGTANYSENKWLVDGMDVGSPSGSGTIANFYPDPFSYEEANYQVGAGSAEMSAGGMNVNMVTRSGTNVFHGAAKFNFAPSRWANTRNYSDELRAQLLTTTPAVALALNPDLEPGDDVQRLNDWGGWLGGPIVRDKLWFSASWHQQELHQFVLGAFNEDGSQGLDTNKLWNATGKISWQMTRNAQLSYYNNTQYKLNGRWGGVSTFNTDQATQYVFKYPTVNQVKFTTPVSSNQLFDATYNRFRSDNAFTPQDGVEIGSLPRLDTVTSTGSGAYPTWCPSASCAGYYTTPLFREQVRANYTLVAGAHDVKFGVEFVDTTRQTRAWAVNDISARYANGLPIAARTYTMPVADEVFPSDLPTWFEYRGREVGGYVQDRFSLGNRVVVQLGLRFETNDGWQPPACMPQSRFFGEEQCFDRIESPGLRSFAPRSSIVWDVRGDGRTVLKGSANRYNLPVNVSLIQRLNPISAPYDTRQWLDQSQCGMPGVLGCDANGDLIPQLEELGPSPGYVFAGVNARYADDLVRPHSREYTVEFQQELGDQGLIATVGYQHRTVHGQIGSINTAVPIEAWGDPITVTEVVSGETVQVWNRPTNASANLYRNDDNLNTTYDGVDLTLNKRFADNWSLLTGITISEARQATRGGNAADPNVVNNPYYLDPLTSVHRPWNYRLSGVYNLPYDVLVSGTWMYMPGQIETTTVSVRSNTISLAQGSQTVVVRPVGDVREPNEATLDLSFRKDFRFANGHRLSPRMDIFNVANNATILSWVTTLGPTYHRPSSIQHGRMWRFELGYEF